MVATSTLLEDQAVLPPLQDGGSFELFELQFVTSNVKGANAEVPMAMNCVV